MRIVIEEPCEHGAYVCNKFDSRWPHTVYCSGAARRILPEGSLVISKENGEWPGWVLDVWAKTGGSAMAFFTVLDALAEGVVVGADG